MTMSELRRKKRESRLARIEEVASNIKVDFLEWQCVRHNLTMIIGMQCPVCMDDWRKQVESKKDSQ